MSKFSFELEAVEDNSVSWPWPFSHIHVLQGIQASCLSEPASFRGTGRSLASDPYGYGECHYDVGNIIDLAITTFVNPFTSDSHRKH